jgi:predicted N-acetyltransferase YhbS
MVQIIPLSQIGAPQVELLLDQAFGEDRKSRTAYKMREGTKAIELLCFAAVDEVGDLLGTLQSWPVALVDDDGRRTPLTLVGPVAVSPKLQRGGIGKLLMSALSTAAANHGHDALMMIGDPEYYGRFFGFSAEPTGKWIIPGPVERHRLLAKITRQGGVPAVGRIVPNP